MVTRGARRGHGSGCDPRASAWVGTGSRPPLRFVQPRGLGPGPDSDSSAASRDPTTRKSWASCAAGLAFGRVASVLQSIERVLAVLGPSPAAVRASVRSRPGHGAPAVPHRAPLDARAGPGRARLGPAADAATRRGRWRRSSLRATTRTAPDVGPGLESFSARALAFDLAPAYGRVPPKPGVCYFFPRPSSGSALQAPQPVPALDGPRATAWTSGSGGVPASRLIVPLDVHVVRLGQCLGLTRYRSPGWRMAAGDHRVAAAVRSGGSGPLRLRALPRGHAGRMRLPADRRGTARCPLRGFCRPRGRVSAEGGGLGRASKGRGVHCRRSTAEQVSPAPASPS